MICTKCNESKDVDAFYTHSDGRPRRQCKACRNIVNNTWKRNNSDKIDRPIIGTLEYAKQLQATRRWRKNNKAYDAFRAKTYRLRKLQQVPPWADIDKIKSVYLTCPEGFHVDHIIPLKGKYVCGLHVENNLQHLPARENIQKSNKYEELS
jgi:hypothetical protein